MYPFFTFCDLSLSDVIDDSALGRVDISTVGSGSDSNSSPGRNMVDSRSETDYIDEDFLVVECRTNNVSDLSASLPTPVSSRQRRGVEDGSRDGETPNSVVNGCGLTCATDEGFKT